MVVGEMLTAVAVPSTYIHKLLLSLRTLAASGKPLVVPTKTIETGQLATQVR
jgi:hypothetical protein